MRDSQPASHWTGWGRVLCIEQVLRTENQPTEIGSVKRFYARTAFSRIHRRARDAYASLRGALRPAEGMCTSDLVVI